MNRYLFIVLALLLAWCGRDGVRAQDLPDADARRVQALQLQIQRAQLDQHAAVEQYQRILDQASQELQKRLGPARKAEEKAKKELAAAVEQLNQKYACEVDLEKLACKKTEGASR